MEVKNATINLEKHPVDIRKSIEKHSFDGQSVVIELRENKLYTGGDGHVTRVVQADQIIWIGGAVYLDYLDGASIGIYDENDRCVIEGEVIFQLGQIADPEGNIRFNLR